MSERDDDIKSLFEHLGLDPADYREVRPRSRTSAERGRWSLLDELASGDVEPARIPEPRRAAAQELLERQRSGRVEQLRRHPQSPTPVQDRPLRMPPRLPDSDEAAGEAQPGEPPTRAPVSEVAASAFRPEAPQAPQAGTRTAPEQRPEPAPPPARPAAAAEEETRLVPRRFVAPPPEAEAAAETPEDAGQAPTQGPDRPAADGARAGRPLRSPEPTPRTDRQEQAPPPQDDFEDAIDEVARAAREEARRRREARLRETQAGAGPAESEPAAPPPRTPESEQAAPPRAAPSAVEPVAVRPRVAPVPPRTGQPPPDTPAPAQASHAGAPESQRPRSLRDARAPKLRFSGQQRAQGGERAPNPGPGLRSTFDRLRHPEKPPVRGDGRLRLRYGTRPGPRRVQDLPPENLRQIFARLSRRPPDPDE